MKARNKIKNNKQGSALVMALIILLVLTLLSLSMLLISYSAFYTANKQQDYEQCMEIAKTLSQEIDAEITIPAFATYEDQKKAMEANTYPLWSYLRCNLWQSNWLYYNEEERGHTSPFAYRYFQMNVSGSETISDYAAVKALADETSILMYWESENYAKRKSDATLLQVIVTCKKNKERYSIHSTYSINIDEIDYTDVDKKNPYTVISSDEWNPSGNSIDSREKWSFSLENRE